MSDVYSLLSRYAAGTWPDGDYTRARSVILDACMEAGPREVHDAVQAVYGVTQPDEFKQHALEIAILYYILAPTAPAGMNSLIHAMTYLGPRQWPTSWRGKRPTECMSPSIAVNWTRKRFRQYTEEGNMSAEYALLDAMRDVMMEAFTECLFATRYRTTGAWVEENPGEAVFRITVLDAHGYPVETHDRGEGMSYSQATKQVIEQWRAEVQDISAAEYLGREGNVALHEVLGWSPIYISTMEMIEKNAQHSRAFSG